MKTISSLVLHSKNYCIITTVQTSLPVSINVLLQGKKCPEQSQSSHAGLKSGCSKGAPAKYSQGDLFYTQEGEPCH